MAINKDSNTYTISFAVILVVVVGGLLAFISTSLKPLQESNVKNEKKQNILNCLPGLNFERSDAEANFNVYVKRRVILDYSGNLIEGSERTFENEIDVKDELEAFNVNLQKEYRSIAVSDRKYPLFECQILHVSVNITYPDSFKIEEDSIIKHFEKALDTIKGLEKLNSNAFQGTGSVKLVFNLQLPPSNEAERMVEDALRRARSYKINEFERFFAKVLDIDPTIQLEAKTYYVIPVTGKGLWDAIWGYISVKSDGETIAGAIFDHKAETPGLGAEINKDEFENQFIKNENGDPLKIGRVSSIADLSPDNFKSIKVVKPGSLTDPDAEVDGISGGTFTSVGVQEMLKRTFYVYYKHFNERNLQTAKL